MRIVLFSIFGYNIYSHGVFLTLALVVGGYLLFRFAKKENANTERFLSNYIISVISALIAARIGFLATNLSLYSNYSDIYKYWQGGLVSFAGFIVGAAVFFLLLKAQKQKIALWLDLASIVFPLAIAIGRIGCVLAGEVGKRYYGTFAYYNHFPVTAFEIYLGLAIFSINLAIYIYARKYLIKYFLFLNFVMLYSLGRAFIDAYRADKSLIIGINLSQLTSFLIFAIAFFVFGIYYIKRKAENK